MKKFIKMICLFSVSLITLNLLFAFWYIYHFKITKNDIPAPNISNSYSFNEKMEFLRKSKINPEVIIIGSSMSLNNLNSESILKQIKPTSFLNTASWGMSMKDDYLLMKIFLEKYKPSTIIIVSNTIDFTSDEISIDFNNLKKFLQSSDNWSFIYHFKKLSLKYYYTNLKYAKKVRTNNNDYEYLGFDKYGTLNYDSSNFVINQERWNSDNLHIKTINYQYSYLDSLSSMCKTKNIRLLFFQSPFRQGLYSKFDQHKIDYLNSHINKIALILQRDGHVFIDSNNEIWEDKLFVDGIHFNKYGAKKFTDYCFQSTLKFNSFVQKELSHNKLVF